MPSIQAKRILFVQPSIEPPGGGNAVAAWMIQALKDGHHITLLTWAPPDLDSVNWFFGTDLSGGDFNLRVVRTTLVRLAQLWPTPLQVLRDNILTQQARWVADRYDLVMTANYEDDLGRPGIQYVHFPRAWYQRKSTSGNVWSRLIGAYYALSARLTGFCAARVRQNLTLVNSDYTGRIYRALYGVEPTTLWPPALSSFPEVAWNQRKDGFVCIGRISPEKRIERMIDIVARVRQAGAATHLHIAGTPQHSAYTESIRRRVRASGDWVFLHENLPRVQLNSLLANHRYGIHAMEDEPFGMAVAEMVAAGCIPFVPAGGGQVEIVDRDERLVYGSVEEAVNKIIRTINDPQNQAVIRAFLATRKDLFSTGHFVQRVREVVEQFPVRR